MFADADTVRTHIDWKSAPSLPLDDPSFDATVLMEFRHRLLVHTEALLLFEILLDKFKEVVLVNARG